MYNLTLTNPPTIEPISLVEAKEYLRKDGQELANGITTEQSITPGSKAIGSVTGAAVLVFGYTTTVLLDSGLNGSGGKFDVKIQDSNDTLEWEDWSSFAQITEANDNQTYEIAYTGEKMYVRTVATITTAACNFAVSLILSTGETSENGYIEDLIKTAREYCEDFQNRAYITQTWEMSMDDFPLISKIELPKGTLQTINSVKYKNSEGTVITLVVNTDYVYSTRGILGRLSPAYGKLWPSFTPFPLDAVIIDFTCGYGDSSSDVPHKVKQAMYLLISHWYKNRLPVVKNMSVSQEIAYTVSALLWMERIIPV